jgi:hypothetical protein
MAKLPDNVATLGGQALSELELKIHGLHLKRSEQNAHVNLKYIQTDFQCFSEWGCDELRAFSAFINKLTQQTWDRIFQTGGKLGRKGGLGMTPLPKDKYPARPVLEKISPDLGFFELRVTQKARVHGFRSANAFFLVVLDKDHSIC